MNARELVAALPGGRRTRRIRLIALLLVVVPVVVVPAVVSLLRDTHFHTTLEVFPTAPPGNAEGSSDDRPALRAVVENPGFQAGTEGWQALSGFALRRSPEQAHSGFGSLASARDRRMPVDGRIASTQVVLPAPGRYSVQAWVRLPHDYRGGPPAVALEGFSGGRRVGVRLGDPALRERWQRVSSDYVVEPQDSAGLLVLRTAPPSAEPGQVLLWDDLRVLSSDVDLPVSDEVNLVVNSGFEHDRNGWGGADEFEVLRSERVAHTGSASLRSSTDRRALRDTNAGHTYIVFPEPGTYRVKAWVYRPKNTREGRPSVFLEGFSGSTQLVQTLGDPARRGTWQMVATDYVISPQDLEGSVVLRDLPVTRPRGRELSAAGSRRVLYWDDVSVTVPRPKPPSEAQAAARLRSALQEAQLRSDIADLTTDDDLYDPRLSSVERSPRKGTLSFIVRVKNGVPSDANRLAQPLRSALLDAARRGTRRQAQQRWQKLIEAVGESLPPTQLRILQRRAEVVDRLIGAQPADVVAPPAPDPGPDPDPDRLVQARQDHEARQRVIARIGDDLPPWQRTLVEQQADNLQRMIAADTAEFLVGPSTSRVKPRRRLDRLLAGLPGPYPRPVGPISAGAAGLLCALLLLALIATTTATRQHVAARR